MSVAMIVVIASHAAPALADGDAPRVFPNKAGATLFSADGKPVGKLYVDGRVLNDQVPKKDNKEFRLIQHVPSEGEPTAAYVNIDDLVPPNEKPVDFFSKKIEEARKANTPAPWPYICRARARISAGNADRLVRQDLDAAAAISQLAWVYCMRGDIFRDQAKFDDARIEYEKALAVDGKNYSTICSRGYLSELEAHALKRQGKEAEAAKKFDDAKRDYDLTLELEPNYSLARTRLAKWYSANGKPDEAIKEFQEALKTDSMRSGIHYHLGRLDVSAKKHNDAIAKFTKALDLEPKLWRAAVERAACRRAVGEASKVENDCKELIADVKARKIDKAGAWFQRALAYSSMSKLTEANREFEALIKQEVDDKNSDALLEWSCKLLDEQSLPLEIRKKAIELAKKSIELTGGKSSRQPYQQQIVLAAAYAATNDWENAMKAQVQAIVFAPTDKEDELRVVFEKYLAKEAITTERAWRKYVSPLE